MKTALNTDFNMQIGSSMEMILSQSYAPHLKTKKVKQTITTILTTSFSKG